MILNTTLHGEEVILDVNAARREYGTFPVEDTTNLLVCHAHGRRGCDDLRIDLRVLVQLPRTKLVHGRLVKPNQRSQRAADQMELVLDDQVGRTYPRNGFRVCRRFYVRPIAVLVVRIDQPMPCTFLFRISEEVPHGTTPRHLRELVGRGDHHRRRTMVHLVVHDLHGDAAALLCFGEITVRIAAIERRRMRLVVGDNITLRINWRTAPWTGRELRGRRAADITPVPRIANSLLAVLERIGGRLVSDPKPQRERFNSPCLRMFLPFDLHCAQKCRSTLELLHRQEAQGIAHDHGQPATGVQPAQVALQTTDRHRERRHAKIRLCLATACREPQQVRVGFQRTCTIRMGGIDQGRNRQKQKRQLERTPLVALDVLIDFIQRNRHPLPSFEGVDRVDALIGHHTVGESERLARIGVRLQYFNPFLEAFKYLTAPLEVAVRLFPVEIKLGRCRLGLLLVDPERIVADQLSENTRIDVGGRRCSHIRRNRPHVELVVRRDVLQRRTIRRARPGDFRCRHFIMRNRRGRYFNGLLIVFRRSSRMDRRVVSDRELDLLAIDHVECLQLGIVLREILKRTLLEDRLAIGRANRDHWLEQPCGIAVLLRLHLLVDEKQRDQTRIANRTRHIAHNADEILANAYVGTVSGNLPLGKMNDLLTAERDTLPAVERLARLGMHDELALRSVIAAPRHLNLNVGKRGVDAECQAHG